MSDFKIKLFRSIAMVINRIEDGKLVLLATRIAQHIFVGSHVPFTDDEIFKLESSLGISHEEVTSVISGITELLLESAYNKMQLNAFQNSLAYTDLDEAKVSALASVWAKVHTATFDALHKRTVLPQVSHVSYFLSMEAGSDAASYQKNVLGRLQLGLKDGDSSEFLDLEFDHEGLNEFHSQLTRIQSQLDAISEK